ncbi:MAG: amidohydrolase [Bacteroidia bacterium]
MQNLKIAGIQFNISWKDKKTNYSYLENEISRVFDADIIVLPEMFQTGFCFDVDQLAEEFENSRTLIWLKEQAQNSGSALLGSFMAKEGDNVYNRLVFMQPNGSFDFYDKRHLFSMSAEPEYFTAGKRKLLINYKGWKICPMVCYDLRFPVWMRNKEQYDLLIFIANWPQRRSMHWEKLLQARAIENQCYVTGINRVGDDGNGVYHDGRSAIINALGEPITMAINQEETLQATLQKRHLSTIREKMPFLNDADDFKLKI